MPLCYFDPAMLLHDTGPKHPERPQRLAQVIRHLQRVGLWDQLQRPECPVASRELLQLVHTPQYLDQLQSYIEQGGGRIEEDTVCSPDSLNAAARAAGAVCDAVQRVVTGPNRRALCLIRPPGHHALADAPMGFCLYGNVAIGAAHALNALKLNRVLIVDWDVHHGNGTQAMFWDDPRVGFLSLHRWPFYPGTGRSEETGGGDALGTKLNVPLEFGITRAEYLDAFSRALETISTRIQPELILVSAGFDAHRDDPVGSLGLEIEDFIPLTEQVLQVAGTYAEGRIVSVLEGGYNPGILAGCVEAHLRVLLEK